MKNYLTQISTDKTRIFQKFLIADRLIMKINEKERKLI